MLTLRQLKLLRAAKVPPPRRMTAGGVVQEPERCLYCTKKYSENDDVYATPGCLLKNEAIPAFGGQISNEIRQYLRSDRYKDSAPNIRDGIEGVYLFPACCSCCKCSSCKQRLADNEEQKQGNDNEGGEGGDGGGFGGEDNFSTAAFVFCVLLSS